MLLPSIVLFTIPARAVGTGADQIVPQVEAAARKYVQRAAAGSGLLEPEITLSVAPGTRPLAPCRLPIAVEALDTRLLARMRFAALCPGSEGWRYEFLVRSTLSARVAVLAVDVPSGKTLADQDVVLERHEVSSLAEAISDPAALAGMSARRALRAGRSAAARAAECALAGQARRRRHHSGAARADRSEHGGRSARQRRARRHRAGQKMRSAIPSGPG